MLVKKQRRSKDESASPSPSRELFVDYPYPIINELTEEQRREQEKESKHHLSLFHWHRDNFRQLTSLLHHLHFHNSASSILEQSLRHAHLNRRASKTFINNLAKETKPKRIRRILPSSMKSSFDTENEDNNKRQSPSIKIKTILD